MTYDDALDSRNPPPPSRLPVPGRLGPVADDLPLDQVDDVLGDVGGVVGDPLQVADGREPGQARLDEVRLDSTVLLFSFCLTVLSGFLFGALPAWRLTRNQPQEALRAVGLAE